MFSIYPGVKQFNNIPSGYPVAVIASFKPNGEFIPLRFCIEINDERFKHEITAIKSMKDNHNVKVFECIYKAHDHMYVVSLRYDIMGCCWVIG